MNYFQLSSARLKISVFSLDLNMIKVEACPTSGVPDFSCMKLKSGLTVFSPDSGNHQETLPEVLRAWDGSYGSNMSEMDFAVLSVWFLYFVATLLFFQAGLLMAL